MWLDQLDHITCDNTINHVQLHPTFMMCQVRHSKELPEHHYKVDQSPGGGLLLRPQTPPDHHILYLGTNLSNDTKFAVTILLYRSFQNDFAVTILLYRSFWNDRSGTIVTAKSFWNDSLLPIYSLERIFVTATRP